MYYNHINAKTRKRSIDSVATEDEPLLARRRSNDTLGLPGSHRRRSSAISAGGNSLAKILEEDESSEGKPWLKNSLSILGVVVVGTAGWAIAWQSGVWVPVDDGDVVGPQATALGAKILGYISAVCYLGYVPSPSLLIAQL